MKTALYDRHVSLGAKIVPFAGWQMPVQYSSILTEHMAVREAAGLFDVSHMGRIHIRGADAQSFLDFLSTNRIKGKKPFSATYTVLCDPDGGCVDDTIIYKIDEFHFFMVANAGNRDKDLLHLRRQAALQHADVKIEEVFDQGGILALQGPCAFPLLQSLVPEVENLKAMQFLLLDKGLSYISSTGYTGSGGFELYGSAEKIKEWWDLLMEKGKAFGLLPAGLGARDTLRLEMGFALYGHELLSTILANESVSSWTVKWDKPDFLGKNALEKSEANPNKGRAYGVRLLDKGIARQGCPVSKEGVVIGQVTSGSFSPILRESIALVIVNAPLQIKERIEIQIRQHLCQAEVVELPFIRKEV